MITVVAKRPIVFRDAIASALQQAGIPYNLPENGNTFDIQVPELEGDRAFDICFDAEAEAYYQSLRQEQGHE